MATQKELEKRILEQESQINSIKDELVKITDLGALKNEILDAAREEIKASRELVESTDLEHLKVQILREAEKDITARVLYLLAIFGSIVLLLGFFGYKNLNTSIDNVSNQVLAEGLSRINNIESKLQKKSQELNKFQENIIVIAKIEKLIDEGNKLIGFNRNSSSAVGQFDIWKVRVASFVQSLDLPKNSEWGDEKMSSLMAQVTDAHRKEGYTDNQVINLTNAALEGHLETLRTKIYSQE